MVRKTVQISNDQEIVEAVDESLGLRVIRSRTPEENKKLILKSEKALKQQEAERLRQQHLQTLFALGQQHCKDTDTTKKKQSSQEDRFYPVKKKKEPVVVVPRKEEDDSDTNTTLSAANHHFDFSFGAQNLFSMMQQQVLNGFGGKQPQLNNSSKDDAWVESSRRALKTLVSQMPGAFEIHNPFRTRRRARSVPIEIDVVPELNETNDDDGDDCSEISTPTLWGCGSSPLPVNCAGEEYNKEANMKDIIEKTLVYEDPYGNGVNLVYDDIVLDESSLKVALL